MQLINQPQKFRNFLPLLLWFLFMGNVFGQIHTQTIRGTVSDAKHHHLEGVTIYLPKLEKGTTTDEDGKFRLEEIPIGRYQLRISYVGFETLVLSEVLVRSGKEEVLDVYLKKAISEIEEIVVKSNVRDQRHAIAPEILTIEETLRLPSSFYDPARLAFAYAGVANTNDQANNMTIRGNTPNNMSWRLEGAEIVNPNHLTGAGTFSDRTTQSGGGVNILSAQMLGASSFYKSSFPTSYGNVLSGIMDMRLRKGNNEKMEYTGQLGLIGIDLAAEGPLKKENGSSFLVNYRYSTLGILSAMGVDLGDEAITFQDLSLHLNFPLKNGGNLSFFGIGGSSSNIFEAPRNDSLIVFEKDLFDINYESDMAAIGMRFHKPLKESVLWKNTLLYSRTNYVRNAHRTEMVSPDFPFNLGSEETRNQSKLSFNSSIHYSLSSKEEIVGGIQLVNITNEYFFFQIDPSGSGYAGTQDGLLFQPFLEYKNSVSNIDFTLGLRGSYYTLNSSIDYEPRLSLKWQNSPNQNIGFAYGKNSQLQFFSIQSGNKDLEPTKAHQFSLSYFNQLNKNIIFKVETYYQYLFNVPIFKNTSNSFSALNVFNELAYSQSNRLENEGTGKNYGIEFSAQQYFSDNVFWLANVSLYQSKYKGSDGIERDTRYNGDYIVNLTGGKEFLWSKKEKDVVLGINARIAFLGGFRETPIDIAASMATNDGTIFKNEEAFSVKKKNYFRPDLRIYLKRNKKKYSSTLALDIQNVSNQQNVSFQYFDHLKNEIVQNYQLGIIPILNYRIEF